MRKAWVGYFFIFVFSLEAKITPELIQQINRASPHELISCIVVMNELYPIEKMAGASLHERITLYRSIAYTSQKPLVDWLAKRRGGVEIHQRYWVINGFHIKASAGIITEIANRKDVSFIRHNGVVRAAILPGSYSTGPRRAVEWNIHKVMADSCWKEGYTGKGIILAITDSGVDFMNPALQGKWSGHWHVSEGFTPSDTPYDDFWHGTHCCGSICGGDGFGPFGDDIGVAPGLKVAVAKVLNASGTGSTAQCIEGLQFIADLKDSVDIKAVSNSWVEGSGTDTTYYMVCRTLKAIDILPIFAIGNTGSNAQDPGTYAVVLGVGATNDKDNLASFSAKGPAPDKTPFNDKSTWYRPDWNLIKPEICAPGENIRSSEPGTGYRVSQGTSMATPHVAGAVGILCQRNPTISAVQVYSILLNNTDEPSQGSPFPNNNYGWGRLNVLKALRATPSPDKPWLDATQYSISDPGPGGNGNGAVEPGETCRMTVTIKNIGGKNGANVKASLLSYDNYIATTSSFNIGALAPGQTASNNSDPFIFKAHTLTPQGHTAELLLVLHADGTVDSLDYDDTVSYQVSIGTAPAPMVIYEDDFEYQGNTDSFSIYWEAKGNWKRGSSESNSPAYSAASGTFTSTNSLILKNGVDLSKFADVKLFFFDKHKFAFPESWTHGRVSVSTNNGGSWSPAHDFAGASGAQSWKTNTASLSAFQAVNVKIRFDVYAQTGSPSSAEWWVDDVKIIVPTDNEPPYFSKTTVWNETTQTGPFPVLSTVTDKTGIKEAALYYRINSQPWSRLVMSAQGNDVYKATIPAQNGKGKIDYYLEATDTWFLTAPNTGTDPVGVDQSGGFYSFVYGSTDIEDGQHTAMVTYCIVQAKGQVNIQFFLPGSMKVTLSVFDVKGREIDRVIENKIMQGKQTLLLNRSSNGRRASSGVYFLNFEAASLDECKTTKPYKSIKKLLLLK